MNYQTILGLTGTAAALGAMVYAYFFNRSQKKKNIKVHQKTSTFVEEEV